MSKVYQPIVIEHTENMIKGLEEGHFFEEYEIIDLSFAKSYLLDILTEKFIMGDLDENSEMFTEEEFEVIIKELVAGSVLNDLKNGGYVDSYEDENTEETFFLTKKGKNHLKNIEDDEKSV